MLKEFTLTNPLTTEERLSLTRLFGHDSLTLLAILADGCSRFERTGIKPNYSLTKLVITISQFEKTVAYLSQREEFTLSKVISDNYIEEPTQILNSLKSRPAGDFEYEVNNFKQFLTELPFLTCVLHNLLKNASSKGRKLVIEPATFPSNPTFVPEGARDYKDFMVFRVCDKGIGFPQNKDWQEYFTRCPPKGEHGFGLYFTGLVAKVLRAPIEIQSIQGDTRVSFYHPIYVDLKEEKQETRQEEQR